MVIMLATTAALVVPALAQNYTITDLGVISNIGMAGTGDTDSSALAINADGTVVGISAIYDTSGANLGFYNQNAFIWKPNSKNGTTGTISYLGALPGDTCVDTFNGDVLVGPLPTVPFGINQPGQAVGYSYTSPGPCVSLLIHGVLWQNGGATDLGYSPPGIVGTSYSYAISINDPGQVVGYTAPIEYSYADVWLYDGSFYDLGSLPGLPYAIPNKINNGGTIVGVSTTAGASTQIISVAPTDDLRKRGVPASRSVGVPFAAGSKFDAAMAGSPSRMNLLAGRGFPSAASRSLQPLDSSSAASTTYSGFVHTGSGPIQPSDQIVTLGGPNSSANGINEAGVVVGGSSIANGAVHGFELNQGVMFDLGTLSTDPMSNSSANAINRANDIVGWSDVNPAQSWMSPQHAVFWESGGNMIDLNSYLPPNTIPPVAPPVGTTTTSMQCPTCWELIAATDINDLGQIVGFGLLNGYRHAFLLTPACTSAGGDTDGDGLCDDWEKNGYTAPDGTFINLPLMGADPNHKDIFVQADYMSITGARCGPSGCVLGHTHEPDSDAVALLIQTFANAPVSNPDGKTGINLHIDCGPNCTMKPGATWGGLSQAQEIQEITPLGSQYDPTCPEPLDTDGYCWAQFDNYKATNFPPSRAPIFHYMIYAHDVGLYNWPTAPGTLAGATGIGRSVPGSDFIVSIGSVSKNNPGGTFFDQASTFMHELGHNLGLHHGGQDDTNYKPNYLSVMNYSFQLLGLWKFQANGWLDYSEFALPPLNETALNETVGLNGGAILNDYGTSWFCPNGIPITGAGRMDTNFANNPINWNCNGTPTDTNVTADVNGARDTGRYDGSGNPVYSTLNSFEDWSQLIFNGGSIGATGVGAAPATYQNPDPESYVAPDPQMQFGVEAVSPGYTQVLPGTSLNLTFTINNIGLQKDTYNLTPVSAFNWWTITGIPSTVTLAGGASQQIMVPVTVSGCVAPGTRGKFTITATSQSFPQLTDSAVAVLPVLSNPSGSVAVPNVVGLTQAAGQAAIVSAGLVVGTITTQSSTTVPAGIVISQSLTACGVVASGSSVALTVSSGPPVVGVPNIVGDTQAAATAAITGAGLTVGTISTAMSTTVPAYNVISQNPAAGTSVSPGSTVSFVISSGSVVFYQVPDLTGLSQSQATSVLSAYELTLGTGTPVLSPTAFMFSIVSQSPAVGSFIATGSPVNVQFSAGSHLYPVPNVVGEAEVQALQGITTAEFEVSVTRQSSTTVPDGYVISQNPAGGTSAMLTSAVNMVVSSGGPVTAAVPNLVGGFAGSVYPAGFSLGSVTTQFSVQPAGTVLSQSPAAGTLAAWDTPINVVLSEGPGSTDTVTIPNVVGMTQAAAITALNTASLSWSLTVQSSTTVEAGNVISQSPAAGLTHIQVFAGGPSGALPQVNLVVSSGATIVPTYTYLSQFGQSGTQQGEFSGISIAIDPVSRNIIEGDVSGRVQIFNANDQFQSYFGGDGVDRALGTWVSAFPGDGTGDGLFVGRADAVAVDPVNHNIVAVDELGERVMIFNSAGQFQSVFGSPGSAPGQFGFNTNFPAGVAIDPVSENIIVTDNSNARVQIFNSAGVFLSQFGSSGRGNGQFAEPAGVAIDPISRNIVVVDYGLWRVQTFDSMGNYLNQFGTYGTGNGQFTFANAAAIDPLSHDIFVTDEGQNRVQIFDSNGNYLSQFGGPGGGNGQMGGGGVASPLGIAIDPVSHNVLVTDESLANFVEDRVEIFAPASIPTTTTVAASINPSVVAEPVTLTATVTGNNPTGTVQFMDGAATLGAPVALTAGVATLTLTTLSLGTHPITAVYSGDASNSGSTSAVLSEVVNPDTTPPVVTPPASISIPATQPTGTTGNAWPALAAFLAGGSAVDPDSPSLTRLAPQVAGVSVDNTTLFPLGTTTVTFGFEDPSGNIGTATSTVTVAIGTPRVTGSSAAVGNDPSGAIYVDIALANTGTGNAQNLVINSLTFRTLSGTGTVTYNTTLSPALPITIGNLNVGTGVTTRVFLNVPSTATRISITESGPVQDVLGNNYNYSTAESLIP